jgi:putative transposase
MAREPYPTDLSDAEWGILAPLVPPLLHPGPNEHNYERREIVNAILYIKRAGCAWRLLPHDLPKWQDVYHWFRKWQGDGTWRRIQNTLRRRVRAAAGREAEPTAVSIDSQGVKVTDTGQPRGFDAGKKIKGKKRHIGVDTLGLLTFLAVTSAGVQDRDGGRHALEQIHKEHPTVRKAWADGAYRDLVGESNEKYAIDLEITTKPEGPKGFVPIPQRWKAERHFGFWNKDRRMSKDVERTTASSEAFATVASVKLLVHALARDEGGEGLG